MVNYEMEWTIRYFLHKSRYWKSVYSTDARPSPGAVGYAHRKAAMWQDLAVYADKSFRYANVNYKSPL